MTNWKMKLAAVGLSTTALVVCILAAVALAGECNAFRDNRAKVKEPVVAPPTKIEEKAKVIVLPCRDVQAIEPGAKVRQKLAEKYHRPDLLAPTPPPPAAPGAPPAHAPAATAPGTAPATAAAVARQAEILGERELPRLPDGGTGLLTLESDGRVELTVVAHPPKFFEWRSTYEAGAVYGVGQEGDTRGRGWVAVEPLRFARLHLRVEGGVDLRAGTTNGYAMAGVVWRSR